MTTRFAALAASLLAFAPFARAADYTVTLSQVHLCCDSCVKDAKEAVTGVPGASLEADKAARTVTIAASDAATAQKAVDALVGAGYYGTPSDPAIHLASAGAKDSQVQGLNVTGLHLCCKMCVKDFNRAVSKVQGVTGTDAAKDAESVQITGTFNAKDVIAALNAAGFSAQVQ
jgi:copper chaperone CopZ